MKLLLIGILICLSAFILSMIGMGGNVLFIPVLLMFKLDLKTVVMPTAYILMLINTFSASVTYVRHKRVRFSYAFPLIGGTIIGALSGSYMAMITSPKVIKGSFAIIVAIMAVRLLRKEIIAARNLNKEEPPKKDLSLTFRITAGIVIGIITGNITGFIGVGGGFIMVPLLLYMGLPAKSAAATSTFIIMFPALTSLSSRLFTGHVDIDPVLLIVCIIAVIIGSQVGAHLMHFKLKSSTVTRILAVSLCLVSIKMGLDAILPDGFNSLFK
jgi:uncharacterized protein